MKKIHHFTKIPGIPGNRDAAPARDGTLAGAAGAGADADDRGSELSVLSPVSVDERLSVCPTGPGVYVMKDEKGHVLYVGKAKNLRSRVRSYFQDQAQHSAKTVHLVAKVRDLEFVRAGSEIEALLLENNLIKKFKPKYNLRLKDDKTYPYLKLDLSHPFPRPYIARKQFKDDGNEYFGPYPMSGALRSALKAGAKLFQLRDCRDFELSNRSRPCLSHQIGQCTAPCVKLVTKEDYAKQVNDFRRFLRGENRDLEATWELEMNEAAEALDFEKAARLRDRLQSIRTTTEGGGENRMVDTADVGDRDVWALWPPRGGDESAVAKAPLKAGAGDLANGDSPETEVEERELVVIIVQIRAGKWMGQVHRTADLTEALVTEDLIPSLMLQHYQKHEMPPEILLPPGTRIPDPELAEGADPGSEPISFAEALAQLSGSGAEPPLVLDATSKASTARLWELAQENARGLFEEQSALRQRKDDGLVAIARMLDLAALPVRMECVDISNMQGEANVASAVVFIHGRPAKDEYRHYTIAGFTGQDDFASMREVMSRRYGKPDSPKPDLLVIDGGKGQLSSALEILKELGQSFPVVGLAKARTERNYKSSEVEATEERLFVPGQKNYIRFRHAEALKIMTHLRDEAHRFAITFHRLKRSRARGI